MKKTVLLVMISFCFVLNGYSQQIEEKSVATYCSSTLMEKILDDKGITYESLSVNRYNIQLNGYNVLMNIDDGDLFLHTYFTITNPSLNRMNDFNAQYRWGRAYIDSDGDLVYASELSFTGGIGVLGIHTFLNTYGQILDILQSHMK
jgi:hypothetical protein